MQAFTGNLKPYIINNIMLAGKIIKYVKSHNLLRFILMAFMIFSCATNVNLFREIDYAVNRSDFDTAIEAIIRGQSGNNVIYTERNSILLFLDKGLLEHYAGNYAASSIDLQNAERLIEEAYTRSISENFLSYILNDNVKEYPGEDFEDIYLNVFNALNYFNMGNTEGALVEIRKLSTQSGKLDMLARRHEYVDPRTGENLNTLVHRETGVSQLPDTVSTNFSNSALARFIGAIFFQGINNEDSARIEFDQVHRAFNTNRNIYRHPVPKAVEEARDINIPEGKSRLNILSFAGLSPIKQEQTILQFLPFRHPVLQIATFKLPVLVRRPSQITRIEAYVNGNGVSQRFNLELLEDMGAVIEETFKTRFSSIFLKTYIRALVKYSIADVAAAEATRRQGGLAGLAVAVAARSALEMSESADIRMSRFLPDRAYIGGINLDPGTYSVIIKYYNGNRVIHRDEHPIVTVTSGGINLLQSVNLK